ncbi:MAG: hypothetical protein WCC48_01505 [Anaeromyxobacteraceae bacterium]
MPDELMRPRALAARLPDWMGAWDAAVRGLLAERPGGVPGRLRAFSVTGIGLAAAMLAALAAVVARVGPHPFLLVMFLAFAVLYFSLVPLRSLGRPFGPGGRRTDADDADDLAEAAARSRRAWEETASRAVAAWHLARETSLLKLEPLAATDPEARGAMERIRALVPPVAPLPGIDVGTLRRAASSPLTELPSLAGWEGVAGGVVYVARRKPFTLGEVLVVVTGVAVVPASLFLSIDGVAGVVACAVIPSATCSGAESSRNLFLLGMISLAGIAILWRLVTRTRLDCPACGSLVAVPRLAPHGRCHGCGRRVWVQWRR